MDHNAKEWHYLQPQRTESKIRRKVDWRLMPLLCWLGIATSMDGVSIGNARIVGLERDLGMTGHDYSFVLLAYFIPGIFFDVPANLLIQISKPRLFLGGFAVLSGVLTICQGLTQSFGGLIACRVLIGISETAFQSGAIFMIASYYPSLSLHKRITPFLATRLVGRAIGGLLAFAVDHLNDVRGLSTWRWLFLILGTFCSLSAIVVAFFIPDWPEKATFLREEEKNRHLSTLQDDLTEEQRNSSRWWLLLKVLRSPLILFSTVIHFCYTTFSVSSSVFLPTILIDLGWSSLQAFSCSIPIFLVALGVSIANAYASDYAGWRYPFCAGPLTLVIAAFGILLAGAHVSTGVQYMACFLLSSGSFAAHATTLTWLSNNINGRRARGLALGVLSGLGNCGFILGSNIFLPKEAPRYSAGFEVCLALSVIAIAAATAQLIYLVWKRRRSSLMSSYPFSASVF